MRQVADQPMHVTGNLSSRVIDRPDQAFAKSGSEGFERLLNQVTQSELEELAQYARFRLSRAGLPPGLAEDVRQSALLAVLVGGQSEFQGRHPRLRDLGDRRAFSEYLKGVIRSLVEGWGRRRESQVICVSIDADTLTAREPDTSELVALNDLTNQLFEKLRERAPARLLPILRTWAAGWREVEIIPLGGKHRRHRQELRALAAKVLRDMANSHPRKALHQPQHNAPN